MENFLIFLTVLLAICGGIATFGAAIKTLKDWKKPYVDLEQKVKQLEEQSAEMKREVLALENKLKKYTDDKYTSNLTNIENLGVEISALKHQIEKNEADTKLILKQLLAIGLHIAEPHEEDHKEKIRLASNEIVEHLISR